MLKRRSIMLSVVALGTKKRVVPLITHFSGHILKKFILLYNKNVKYCKHIVSSSQSFFDVFAFTVVQSAILFVDRFKKVQFKDTSRKNGSHSRLLRERQINSGSIVRTVIQHTNTFPLF